MRDAEQCPARRVIDRAAAKALDVSEDVVAEWRRRIACEPTVSNKYAQTAQRSRNAA